jgi:DNA-binding transcriptional ArsR family regulator
MAIVQQEQFGYDQSMDVREDAEIAVSRIAAAIGEPARARILYSLMDGRARTSTELAVVAEVSPSTASIHLGRLKLERLLDVTVQGKHRYYSLAGPNVASVLEGLSVLAGGVGTEFQPNTPNHLRAARTCYDHMAGKLGVLLHDRFHALGWLKKNAKGCDTGYDLMPAGAKGFEALGVEVEEARALRRRFVCGCLDWSERRHHLGGALGAALLTTALKRKWVARELDSRVLSVTAAGRRELEMRLGLSV